MAKLKTPIAILFWCNFMKFNVVPLLKDVEVMIHSHNFTYNLDCSLNTTALELVLIVCAVQSVANLAITPFLSRVGRRNMVMMISSVCGISGIFVNIFPNAIMSFVLFTIQLVGMICMGYYTAIAVSIFPTVFRAMGVTIAVTGNRISMFFSIQILNYLLNNYCELGFFIFCALFTSSSLLTMWLPNDKVSTTRRLSIVQSVFGLSPKQEN